MDGFARISAAPALARLDAAAPFAAQLDALRRDGALILDNALTPAQLEDLNAELDPWFARAPGGEGAFFGRRTRRFGALLAKAPSTVELVLHPRTLPLCERLLIADDIGPPRCDRIQLNVAQAIGIGPGEPEQVIHRDQKLFWIDPGYELLVNVMFCLDAFNAANGGTMFAPGSCAWPRERWPEPHEVVSAEAPAGAAILWVGSMIHGGGANLTDRIRRGVTVSYNLGWLAQTEKLLLSVAPDIARALPERAQQLIGYQVHRPSLGWVEGRDPIEWLRGGVCDVGLTQDHLPAGDDAIVENYYAERTQRLAGATP
jgi:hypothetical protein